LESRAHHHPRPVWPGLSYSPPGAFLESTGGSILARAEEVLDKRTSTAAARALADRFGGDPGAADWRHFGRLAGFTNRKPQYRRANGLYPFVQIADHNPGVVHPDAPSFLRDVRDGLHRQEANPGRPPAARSVNGHLKSIEDFRADPVYRDDGNRIDLAYAVYALARGAGDGSVRAAIQKRDLSKKGSEARQLAYVLRTIAKARQNKSSTHRER
jgi:hypothetical protein